MGGPMPARLRLLSILCFAFAGCNFLWPLWPTTETGSPVETVPALEDEVFHQSNKVVIEKPGTYKTRMGQPVLFPYGYIVVPSRMYSLSIKINGERVEKPEFVNAPDSNPGYSSFAYVFRPPQKGTYRIDIAKVYLPDREVLADHYILRVSD
jgi:hypothetical protein